MICQAAVASGTNIGDVSCLVVGTSVTTVTKTSTAGAYAATITDASGETDVVTTCDAMVSTYGNGAPSRRCIATDTTSVINLFDTTTDVTEFTAGITGALHYTCGATYDELTTLTSTQTTTTGNYACYNEDGTHYIEKYDKDHTKTWDCEEDTTSNYSCTAFPNTSTTGYINVYWGQQDQPVVKNYSAAANKVTETLASTCLSDGTNSWCDIAADGTATITVDVGGTSVATCTAVAADSSQTCTWADDAYHIIKYEADGGFTEKW
jgi:hypothetical protein